MGFFDKLVTSIFGSKNDREYKEMQPLVVQINAEYDKLKGLSNDELRHKTVEFRQRIAEHLSVIDKEIADLKASAESEEDLQLKDDQYKKVDGLRKDRDKLIEEILQEILPEAFADNRHIDVIATEH